MRILFVSQWYYPEPDGRVSALAEGLVKLGHDVQVLTGFPNYPTGSIYEGYKVKLIQKEVINGVEVSRLPIYADHSRSTVKRALNYLSFMLSLMIIAPWHIKKNDVMWAYTPFMTIPVLWFRKLFNLPFVMEIADLWPDTIVASGMMKDGYAMRLLNSLANLAYNNAATITVQNPGFKPFMVNKGVNAEKIRVIPNWADEDLYFPLQYDLAIAGQLGIREKFVVMFAGNMGIAQALDNVIKAAVICKEEKDIVFVFVGNGACYDELQTMVKNEKLENVIFTGRKPASDMSVYFSIADIMLVTLKDEPLFDITLPAKTQSYLACGKPVILAKGGQDADFLQESGCALVCEPENPQALFDAIMKVYQMEAGERQAMGEKSLKLYDKKYKKDNLLIEMETALYQSSEQN